MSKGQIINYRNNIMLGRLMNFIRYAQFTMDRKIKICNTV